MSAEPRVVVHADADQLVKATAARLITALVDAASSREQVHLVLTGGGAGIGVLAAVAADPARDAVAWDRVQIWWGDERYLPEGDADRNATQAWDALLTLVPVPAGNVHEMPASDAGFGSDVEAAATSHAADLATFAEPDDASAPAAPVFDVLLLGVGPDGHIASLFPGHPMSRVQDRTVVGVRESPKPPPERISMTVPVIQNARQVWLVAAGAEKAAAVARGVSGDADTPAAWGRGREVTLWLLDGSAASDLTER